VLCWDAAAGGTDDYVKAVHDVKYSFVAELRGDDFIVDRSQIQPSFDEVWSGIVAMCDAIAAKEDWPTAPPRRERRIDPVADYDISGLRQR